jgi:hypothetical protein
VTNNDDRTVPSQTTREEEARDAQVPAGDVSPSEAENPGREATPPQEVDEETAGHYEEMIERGAHQQGEGRIP